jgi:glycosyltransferase involved in cell wall biosynthesis
MISCLVLSRYGSLGPSSRVRFEQYFDALAEEGINCRLSPLLADGYLALRYANSVKRHSYAVAGFVRRVFALLQARSYDVVWLEGELFPWLPGMLDRLLTVTGIPYVVDYDDALFHKYDRILGGPLRNLYRDKFSHLLSASACVTVGNAYLKDICCNLGAPQVIQVPSVVDTERYILSEHSPSRGGPLVIGWIGTPHTAKYLWLIEPVLRQLASEIPLVFMTVGAGPLEGYGVPIRQFPWSLETEMQLIRDMDIGVMPLLDTPWERGKCGYKLIQYMAMAKPVVASSVGSNCEIVSHGVNGFLAVNESGWLDSLRQLAASLGTREAFGNAGRQLVEERYSVRSQVSVLARALRDAAGKVR